jgi:hypothetical protein
LVWNSFKRWKSFDTVDLKRRVKLYKDFQRDGYGAIIVQANVKIPFGVRNML